MALRRTTLILLVILILAIAAAVVGYIMFPEKVRDALGGKSSTNSTTNSTVVNTNSTTTPTNLSTTQDLSGDTPLTATIKVGTTEVKFTSLDRMSDFNQTTAPAKEEFVVMYFEGLDSAATQAVFAAMKASQLVNGDQRLSPNTLKVAANIVKNDRGYVAFLVPTTATKLVFELGSGTDVQRIELP